MYVRNIKNIHVSNIKNIHVSNIKNIHAHLPISLIMLEYHYHINNDTHYHINNDTHIYEGFNISFLMFRFPRRRMPSKGWIGVAQQHSSQVNI